MRRTGFIGTALILGIDREVEFRNGTLHIEGMTLPEAERLVDALEGAKEVHTLRVPGNVLTADPPEPARSTPAAAQAPPQKAAETPAPAAASKTTPSPAKSSSAPAPAAAAPKAEPPKASEPKPETKPAASTSPKKEEPPKPEPKAAPPVEDEEDDGGPPIEKGEEIAKELIEARKLRDVLVHLQAHGFHTPDAVVAEVTRLKATGKIPLLDRVTDVDERVRRTLEVLDGG